VSTYLVRSMSSSLLAQPASGIRTAIAPVSSAVFVTPLNLKLVMRSPAFWQRHSCLELRASSTARLLHPYKSFSISECPNIADAILVVHKPHAGEIGNRLADLSPEFGPNKPRTAHETRNQCELSPVSTTRMGRCSPINPP